MIDLLQFFAGLIHVATSSPLGLAASFGLAVFGYTWTTKVANTTAVAAAHINKLQDEKADLDMVDLVIRPEQYGAVGDDKADDHAAFLAMWDDIKTGGAFAGYIRRRVILNPAVRYRISSRTSATNVFLIPETAGLSIEGPGKEVPVFVYDGPTATNFFNFAGGNQAVKIEDVYISGGEGTDLNNYPIENILYFDNVNYCSIINSTLDRCTGYGIGGFNWYTKLDHVEFTRCDIGVGPVSTTVLCSHVYANSCRIGFEVDCWYGTYISCACDWADVMFDLREPWSVAIIGCGCEKVLQPMSGRALQLSVNGLTFDQTDLLGEFTFTSGGTYEITPGDTITGATSGSTAVVSRVHLTSGSWAGGDAAGTIRVTGTPSGAFSAENINVGANSNVATLAGDITNSESSFKLDQTRGRITGLFGKVETQYWFDCNDTCPDLMIGQPSGFDGCFKAFVKDYESPVYGSVPEIVGHPHNPGYDQRTCALASARSLWEKTYSFYDSRMWYQQSFPDGTATYTSTVKMQKIRGTGHLRFKNDATVQGPIFVFDPASGDGLVLEDIDIPIVFQNIYFKLNQNANMIKVTRCREVRFENCKFENTSGAGGYPFDIDKYSKVILDKDTMDDMVTATWNGLDNGRRWDAIEFIGFTATPAAGLFDAGHRVWFQSPAAGAYSGNICTSGGAPGTWKGVAILEA